MCTKFSFHFKCLKPRPDYTAKASERQHSVLARVRFGSIGRTVQTHPEFVVSLRCSQF